MPCHDPELDADGKRLLRVVNLAFALSLEHGYDAPLWFKEAMGGYPVPQQAEKLNAVTAWLCHFCREIGDDFIYDGRFRLNRALADWWDDHKESAGHAA